MTRAPLSGRTAIVTGAGHCTGAAVSRALSRAGASVVLAASDAPALEALAADISSAGGHAVAVPTDLTNPVSVQRLIEQTLGAFGRLDAAFNNGPASLAMRYEIPSMRRTGGGRIVNLAPTTDTQAVELTRTTALNFANTGVQINAVTAEPHATADDVANAIVWLCSDNTTLLAGEVLYLPSVRPLWT